MVDHKPLEFDTIKPVRSDVRILWAMAGAGARESLGEIVATRVLSKVTKSQKILGMSLTRAGALLGGYVLFKFLPDDPEEMSLTGFGKGFAAGVMIDAGGEEIKARGLDVVKIISEKSGTATTRTGNTNDRTPEVIGGGISLDGL